MDQYLDILENVEKDGLDVYEVEMKGLFKGLYLNRNIFIKKDMTFLEKKCVLCEEWKHHLYTVGNILDKSDIGSMKQEIFARRKAYEYLVPLTKIQEAMKGCDNIYQLAEKLNVTESFLNQSIEYYISKFGTIYNIAN